MSAPYSLPSYTTPLSDPDASPLVNSPDDQRMLDGIGEKYKALAPHMKNAAVVESPDAGDERQLEFHHPMADENPVPGRMTFQLFKPFAGAEREDAVTADALHYLGGRTQDDAGRPVDPKWREMRDQMWNLRTPGQRAVDIKEYSADRANGDNRPFDEWADRNRKDAYVRAGIFPHRNPDWNRGPEDPLGWTAEQQQHFAAMRGYLVNGR